MTTIYDSPLVAAAANKILRAAKAATADVARNFIDAFREDAYRSDEHFEAAFLAAQMLRDLGRIDPDEAASVFDRLFDDPHLRRRRYGPSTAAFYRAHGETELATMMERRGSTYEHYCIAGELSLIGGKPTAGDRPVVDTPSSVAHIAERTLALSAAVSKADRVRQWNNLVRAASTVSVNAAVTAVRRLREIGAVTPDEYAWLVDTIIGKTIEKLANEDRTIHRLRRASTPEGHKTLGAGRAEESRRARAKQRLTARLRRIKAAYLRQLGEHDLAQQLLSEPGVYDLRVMQGPFASDLGAMLDVVKRLAKDS